MLKMKHKHHLDFPHITFRTHEMALSPVTADDDELSQAIVDDPVTHDDVWELSERPDTEELTQFWSEVEADVANDPEWFKFNSEE
jgi:hypothetical protein